MYLKSVQNYPHKCGVLFTLITFVALTGCVSSDLNEQEINAVVDGANTNEQAISWAQQQLAQQRAPGQQQPAQPTLYPSNRAYQSARTAHQTANFESSESSADLNANAGFPQQYNIQYKPSGERAQPTPKITVTDANTDSDSSNLSDLQDQQAFSANFDMELEVEIDDKPILKGPTIAGAIGGNRDVLRVLLRDSGGETVIKQPGDEIFVNGELYSIAKTDASFVLLRSSNGDYVVIK
ncbi:MAG: hypothetical protein MK329_10840 [Pirellulales bacterium]|nr:hypothetical protein [Pirellulales bacterium]